MDNCTEPRSQPHEGVTWCTQPRSEPDDDSQGSYEKPSVHSSDTHSPVDTQFVLPDTQLILPDTQSPPDCTQSVEDCNADVNWAGDQLVDNDSRVWVSGQDAINKTRISWKCGCCQVCSWLTVQADGSINRSCQNPRCLSNPTEPQGYTATQTPSTEKIQFKAPESSLPAGYYQCPICNEGTCEETDAQQPFDGCQVCLRNSESQDSIGSQPLRSPVSKERDAQDHSSAEDSLENVENRYWARKVPPKVVPAPAPEPPVTGGGKKRIKCPLCGEGEVPKDSMSRKSSSELWYLLNKCSNFECDYNPFG